MASHHQNGATEDSSAWNIDGILPTNDDFFRIMHVVFDNFALSEIIFNHINNVHVL